MPIAGCGSLAESGRPAESGGFRRMSYRPDVLALVGSNVQQAQAWQPGRPASGSAHDAGLLRVHRRGGLGPTLAWLAAPHGERAP